jgi:RHS repeat-associated protein
LVSVRSDSILVTSSSYDSAGNLVAQTNPANVTTCFEHDAAGRRTVITLNCHSASSSSSSSSSSGGSCVPSDDLNVTVVTAYTADGNVASITANNSTTGNQTTEYTYGTTLSDSAIASSKLKRSEIYPDSVGGTDQILFSYNRQQQMIVATDQNGTVHAYDYDKLGRQTQDRVTTLGSAIDGTIRRLMTTYEVRGMKARLTSFDNATVASGSVINECLFLYNDFAQLVSDYQSHSGSVSTGSTPSVDYGFANGSENAIRPTNLTYPNGRVITYDYNTAGSISDSLSRADAIKDGSTALAQYSYLGRSTFVITDYTEPSIEWTIADLSGTIDPDTGDIYSGFDRFGRVKDNRWYDYGSAVDVDRIKYGYDPAGNRIYHQNLVATTSGVNLDELYSYDLIDRLKTMDRGQLSSLHNAITNKSFGQCWSLDSTGNWRRFLEDSSGNGVWDLNQSRTGNTVNEITNISTTVGSSWTVPVYDAAGNMTTVPQPASPTQSFTATYDAWNRLVKVEVSATLLATYSYDALRRRISQNTYSGGVLSETRHIYYTEPRKWQVVEERIGSSSSAESQFIWGVRYIDDLIVRDRDASASGTLDERLYSLQDANWNVTAIADASGMIQERYNYSAYGMTSFMNAAFSSRPSSSFNWESLFCGYRFSSDTGMFHVRHRVYHFQLGVWLSRDPLGLQSNEFNLYQYVIGSPISHTDPSGQQRTLQSCREDRNACEAYAAEQYEACVEKYIDSVEQLALCYEIVKLRMRGCTLDYYHCIAEQNVCPEPNVVYLTLFAAIMMFGNRIYSIFNTTGQIAIRVGNTVFIVVGNLECMVNPAAPECGQA